MDKTIELRRLLEAELSKRKQEAGLWNQRVEDRQGALMPGNFPSGRGRGWEKLRIAAYEDR